MDANVVLLRKGLEAMAANLDDNTPLARLHA